VQRARGRSGRPDLVAYVGWEWTQTGITPDVHFGHKNVIFPVSADDELPARPISALGDDVMKRARYLWLARGAEGALSVVAPPYADFLWWIRQLAEGARCAPGVDVHDLPRDCMEGAGDPAVLFEKLAQWQLDSLVIPHGLTWGIHAPPGASIANQLTRARHDPERQRLLEVYSGHGAAERFDAPRRAPTTPRARRVQRAQRGLPALLLAGRRDRAARCADPDAPECRERVEEARRLALAAGRDPQWVLPDAASRSGSTAIRCAASSSRRSRRARTRARRPRSRSRARASATRRRPLRFRFGLIASSDTHSARAGSGYKQVGARA
jgi:hypothetical protein